jgi:hypothetical protein
MLPVGSEPVVFGGVNSAELQSFLQNFLSNTTNIALTELLSAQKILEEIFHAGGEITEQVFISNGAEKWPCLKRRDLAPKYILPPEEPLSLKRYLVDQLAYFKTESSLGVEATEAQIIELFARMFPTS